MPPQSTAPINLDVAALQAAGGPVAAQLLPGWTISWVACSQEEIDALLPPGPNLAVCRAEDATPTRELATIYVVTPWPAHESLRETLSHELTHAWISPLVALVPDSAAAVMLEEQLVERMGRYLAGLPAAARRAQGVVVDMIAPAHMRARISARAGMRARGGQMDPEQIKAAIAALKEGNGEGALAILEALVVAAASGGKLKPEGEKPGAAPGAAPGEPAAKGTMPAPAGGPPMAARKEGSEEDSARARLMLEDIARMHATALPAAKATLITAARARVALTPATEKRIMAAPTFEAAEAILTIVEEAGGGTSLRARSGVEHKGAPDTSDAATKGVEDGVLQVEGFDAQWIARYRARLKDEGAEAGAAMLERGRDARRRTKARLAKEAAQKAVAS